MIQETQDIIIFEAGGFAKEVSGIVRDINLVFPNIILLPMLLMNTIKRVL